MLSFSRFTEIARSSIPRFSRDWLNQEQEDAVAASPHPPVIIVAGPGTGKTTVLALRVLKLIFVDGMEPATIIATTFTQKAAAELRSRILSWGFSIQTAAQSWAQSEGNIVLLNWLDSCEVNSVLVDTLDSLAQQLLADNPPEEGVSPVVIDKLTATAIMRRDVLFRTGLWNDPSLRAFLQSRRSGRFLTFGDIVRDTLSFADRVAHDRVDLDNYLRFNTGGSELVEAVRAYLDALESRHVVDFAQLETSLLYAIIQGHLASIMSSVRAVLVDEFQDTNHLQEQIYLELCRRTGASLTVVGDDDQSIYRFRGATVEIFASFESRVQAALQMTASRYDLFRNYRSTRRIVRFCDCFLTSDPNFVEARSPGKVRMTAERGRSLQAASNIPVLGMFRGSLEDLAVDLSNLLYSVFRGSGYRVDCGDSNTFLIRRAEDGDFGDSVLLGHSVQEQAPGRTDPRRLPLLIRQQLAARGIDVFNPRGQRLRDIPEISRLLGLALECIDPMSRVQNSLNLSLEASTYFRSWRSDAQAMMVDDPAPGGLREFVLDWARRQRPRRGEWPPEWPVLELLFTLATWIPRFYREPEGQVYLEALARGITQIGQITPFRSQLRFGATLEQPSIKEALWEFFYSVASDIVDVDEEIMPYVPRSCFPIMTIHQAKGLEFPLVIVDIGSDFTRDHPRQRRVRFPDGPDYVHLIEDEVANSCPVGTLRSERRSLDRAIDDIKRLYFVAYSRAESVLLLVGRSPLIRQRNPIPSVAAGSTRQGIRIIEFVSATDWAPNANDGSVVLI